MTVLPELRDELVRAAARRQPEAQPAPSRRAWRGFRVLPALLALAVSAAIAVVAVTELRHRAPHPSNRSVATGEVRGRGRTTHAGSSVVVTRRLLNGNGIGSLTFGQARGAVIAGLERLLGPPHETIPGICGFGRSTDWIGLDIRSRNTSSAELNLSFKHSRFVGYAYASNAHGSARQRHGVLIATARGLTLGDSVARARHLYGRAFVNTSLLQGTPPSAKLPRLPVGEVSTLSGKITVGIQGFGRRDRVSAHSAVVSIAAGVGPVTPCR